MTFEEKKQIFKNLKKSSGSHSPSISTLRNSIDDLKIDVDGCFLSNPYAGKKKHYVIATKTIINSIIGKRIYHIASMR